MEPSIAFSIQADPATIDDWTAFARACESDGFDALLVADHPGSGSSPFVALAAAATATDRLRLGTYVVNAGAWEPLALAAEVATLDLVSGGRAILGIGAGHTPAEWTMVGRAYPSPRDRVARLLEVVPATRRLLAGEHVTLDGDHVMLEDAHLERPRPVQPSVPLLVGGNGTTLLRFAAREADIVGFSGLGKTLPDGHRHEVRWNVDEIDQRVDLVRTAAEQAGRSPEFEALVQHLEITDDAEAAAHRLADDVSSLTPEQVLAAPYVLMGTVADLVDEVRDHQRRWGFTRFVVRAPVREQAADLLEALRRTPG